MSLLQWLHPGDQQALEQKRRDEAVQRILAEVGRGVLATRWDIVHARILANRLFIRNGGGDDFFQIREFQYGDAWRTVDPRKTMATAGQKIWVREYRPELQDVWYILFDGSPTHDFAGLRQSKLDVCARGAATVCMCAKAMDDLVGCIVYSGNKVVRHIRPSYPRTILHHVVQTVLEPPFADGDPDEGLAAAIKLVPKDGPVNIVWLTDGLNLKEKGLAALDGLKRLEGVRKVVVPQDFREQYLPEPTWSSLGIPPRIKVFDLRTHEPFYFVCNKAGRERYTREWAEHTQWLRDALKAKRMGAVVVQTEHETEARHDNEEEREQALTAQRIKAVQEMVGLFASP
jgi:uncharacterized protein (DUF58 family)